MREIIQANFITFTIFIILTLFICTSSAMSKEKRNAFLIGIAISFIMLLCNIQNTLFLGQPSHLTSLKIFSAISYTVSGPIIMAPIYITGVLPKKMWRFLIGLAAINAVLCFVSIFNGCIFYYDARGYFHTGKLILIPFIFSVIYLIVLLSMSLKKFRSGYHGEAMVLVILAVLVIMATFLNNVLDFKFLVGGMSVVALLIYYLFFTIQLFMCDALTGALNRHSFYTDIARASKQSFFIISLDLNGLKELNDTYGHMEGDNAIKAVADCAMLCKPLDSRFYRMGGDEFAVICPSVSEVEIRRFIAALKDEVEKKGYKVAAGYALFNHNDRIRDVIAVADERMYADKAAMKGLANIRR